MDKYIGGRMQINEIKVKRYMEISNFIGSARSNAGMLYMMVQSRDLIYNVALFRL